LDRGLELNVLYKDQNIRYHVFGQGDDYCLNRKLLSDFVSINEESNERDSIIFHKDAWNNDEDLLRNADRIILASDSEWENIDILHTIQKFFSIKGDLYIYNSNVRSVATSFGQARDILTPAFVLHNRLTDMALCRHEMFRFYSGEDIGMWEDISSLAKDMNYSATDHISIKVRIALGNEAPHSPFDEISSEILRKAAAVYHSADEKEKARFLALEHERCLRFYKIHNYRFGEKTDDNARTSPLVCSFEELSEQKKMVAETGWMLLDELASHKEARRK
nr:hypothetical protein [Lachnospiraceae bacterium]